MAKVTARVANRQTYCTKIESYMRCLHTDITIYTEPDCIPYMLYDESINKMFG